MCSVLPLMLYFEHQNDEFAASILVPINESGSFDSVHTSSIHQLLWCFATCGVECQDAQQNYVRMVVCVPTSVIYGILLALGVVGEKIEVII